MRVSRQLCIHLPGLILLTAAACVQAQPANNASADPAISQLMKDARAAMKEAQYDRAIQTYQEILDLPEHAFQRDALELLGLAYERAGNLTKAQETYERYIQLYPRDDATQRVKQRLAGITTATWTSPEKLKVTKRKPGEEWQLYGSLSQYIRRDVSQVEDLDSVVNQFALASYVDFISRKRGDDLEIKTRLTASDYHDLDSTNQNDQRLSYAYLDLNYRQRGSSLRLGRQNASGGGVLGRFDGIDAGYRLSEHYKLGVVAGLPVERTSDMDFDTSRYFYGVNLETGPWRQYWEANTYLIEQQADGLLDRRAVGGELRYLHPTVNLYSLVDYDIAFSTLNIFSAQGSYTSERNDTYTFIIDYRNAPVITATNALIGQFDESLSDLKKRYSTDELNALARDRTSRSTLYMLGYTHPIGDRYRWDFDISTIDFAATPASGDVPASEASSEYYASSQFTVMNLLRQGDSHILGLGYNLGDTYDTTTLNANSRLPAGDHWHINPRLILSQTSYDNGDSLQRLAPGLKVDYQLSRTMLLEFDSLYEISKQSLWYGDQDSTDYYLDIGYRWDF